MAAVSTSAPQYREYRLEGGVTVRDKTNGVATAFFLINLTAKDRPPAYRVYVHHKKLIFPICSDPSSNPGLSFRGSKQILFEPKGPFIEITEIDDRGPTVLYVDPRRRDVAYYDVYPYVPRELALEEAARKIPNRSEFGDFQPDMAAYNRHGVAVFGCEQNKGYALYWANPYEGTVKKMETIQCERYRDGGTSIAKSKDGFVNFRYLSGKGFYLNAEPATKIELTPPTR